MSVKPSTPTVFNSTSKIQEFFGVDDIDIDQIQPSPKRSSASDKLKRLFGSNSNSNHKKRDSQKLSRRLSKLKRPKLFGKSSKKKNTKSSSAEFHIEINPKIVWRPSLHIMLNDDILLDALTKHMESMYNAENILFLIAVRKFKSANLCDIDSQITAIYNLYIKQYAKQQVNLSHYCLMNTMANYQQLHTGTLSTIEKTNIFDQSVEEIESLISKSVLASAYHSQSFQRNAKKSKQYKVFLDANMKYHHRRHCRSMASSFDLTSSSSPKSPYSALSSVSQSPPIKLVSCSYVLILCYKCVFVCGN